MIWKSIFSDFADVSLLRATVLVNRDLSWCVPSWCYQVIV